MPNYAQLFREAVEDAKRDYILEHPEIMIPGFWLIRLHKRAPLIPARTYLTSAEPGNPENILDRWPLPILAGEIIGEVVDPADIFAAPERQPIEELASPVRLSIEAHYNYLVADAKHAARSPSRRHEPIANPRRVIDLTRMKPLF